MFDRADRLPPLSGDLRANGYALTLGVQTRLESTCTDNTTATGGNADLLSLR